MTISRKNQVLLEDTRYYHCVSRCVRRAFLCGEDGLTKRNFDHRKGWMVKRFHQLAAAFGIRICAYAVMSNHYHLVLYVDSEQAADWTPEEVNMRWSSIFKSNAVKPNLSGIGGACEDGLSQTDIKRRRLQEQRGQADITSFTLNSKNARASPFFLPFFYFSFFYIHIK